MPPVPSPESLPDSTVPPRATLEALPEKMRLFWARERPFEFRMVEPLERPHPPHEPPTQRIWIRTVDRLPDDEALHRCLLAYVSDFYLLHTATLPHSQLFRSGRLMMASIDHAMWFHWPLRVDEWFLYAIDSPSASGARGFSRGSVFSRDGKLVASTAQEGLMRIR